MVIWSNLKAILILVKVVSRVSIWDHLVWTIWPLLMMLKPKLRHRWYRLKMKLNRLLILMLQLLLNFPQRKWHKFRHRLKLRLLAKLLLLHQPLHLKHLLLKPQHQLKPLPQQLKLQLPL